MVKFGREGEEEVDELGGAGDVSGEPGLRGNRGVQASAAFRPEAEQRNPGQRDVSPSWTLSPFVSV